MGEMLHGKKCCGKSLLVRQTSKLRELYCYTCRTVYASERIEKRSLSEFLDKDEEWLPVPVNPLEKVLTEVGEIVRAHDRKGCSASKAELDAARKVNQANHDTLQALQKVESALRLLEKHFKEIKKDFEKVKK